MPHKVKPGELRAYGYRDQKSKEAKIRVVAGEGVSENAVRLLTEALTAPHETYLSLFVRGEKPWPSLCEELTRRGYALETLRFSAFMKDAEFKHPKYLRSISCVPGVLQMRWGADPTDRTPDVCASWAQPCEKPDMNLLFCWWGTPRVNLLKPTWLPLDKRMESLDTILVGLGFDLRTFRLKVKKASTAKA